MCLNHVNQEKLEISYIKLGFLKLVRLCKVASRFSQDLN